MHIRNAILSLLFINVSLSAHAQDAATPAPIGFGNNKDTSNGTIIQNGPIPENGAVLNNNPAAATAVTNLPAGQPGGGLKGDSSDGGLKGDLTGGGLKGDLKPGNE